MFFMLSLVHMKATFSNKVKTKMIVTWFIDFWASRCLFYSPETDNSMAVWEIQIKKFKTKTFLGDVACMYNFA